MLIISFALYGHEIYLYSFQIDPFTNKVVLSKCQMLQICICSITIAPIRLLFTVLILLFMWFLVRIGLLCLSDEKLKTKPHTGWRKGIQKMLYGLGKVVCFCCGFYDITIVGERVSSLFLSKHQYNVIFWFLPFARRNNILIHNFCSAPMKMLHCL